MPKAPKAGDAAVAKVPDVVVEKFRSLVMKKNSLLEAMGAVQEQEAELWE